MGEKNRAKKYYIKNRDVILKRVILSLFVNKFYENS